MPGLMRCQYCGLLQDEPAGVKTCARCGGELAFEKQLQAGEKAAYMQVQLELDQVTAPADRNVDRYLLATIRSPKTVPSEEMAATRSGRPALAFTAVLDTSGSMGGSKITQAKEAVRQALYHLQDGDDFSLVTFSSTTACPIAPRKIDDDARHAVESLLKEIDAGGQTALCGGLELGIEKTASSACENRLLLLLSDGQANVGETDIEKVGLRAAGARQEGMVVSTLGVGDDYAEALMADIAGEGGGRFYHLADAQQIPAFLTGEMGEVANLAARQVELRLTLPQGAVLMPLSAAYPSRQEGEQVVVSIGVIPCDVELEISMRMLLPAQPAGSRVSVEGELCFTSPAGHACRAELNRVTLRVVEHAAFAPAAGLVKPVAEKVLAQMEAQSVISVSRAWAIGQDAGHEHVRSNLQMIRDYAALLGKERAEQEEENMSKLFSIAPSSPAAKASLYQAQTRIRSSKDFNNKS